MTENKRKTNRIAKKKPGIILPVADAMANMPQNYADFISDLKNRIRQERTKAVLAANSALVLMYWDIGTAILAKQKEEGWGTGVIDRMSRDLKEAFPDMKGFSARNLKYMRKFAETWRNFEIVQRTVAQIPWRSNIALIDKLKENETRLWYARQTVENGWSRNVLVFQIESNLHKRIGQTANNFEIALPPADSDMANQIFKDPYIFDFMGTADTRRERELENKLIEHMEKEKNHTLAKYALAGYTNPIGVAEWEKQITDSLPDDLKSSLPTIDEIENELELV